MRPPALSLHSTSPIAPMKAPVFLTLRVGAMYGVVALTPVLDAIFAVGDNSVKFG